VIQVIAAHAGKSDERIAWATDLLAVG